jgi:hypothetical protein
MTMSKRADWKKFKQNKAKGSLWQQFKDSVTLRPILHKWLPVRPRKAKVCECGSVSYKTLSALTVKQLNVIQAIAEACVSLEHDRDHIREEAIEQLDAKDNTIKLLTKRLEVMRHVN